jgi:hypothetical protein
MFATRTITLSTATGTVNVVITINPPYQEPGAWVCTFEVGWPTGPFRQVARGIDGVQAMLNAMKLIGAYLYGSAEHIAGRLSWTKEGGYGFPVPGTMRGELVGLDKEFYG